MANYLTFSSPSSFTLRTANYGKNWNGTLEYSTDASAWNTWSGSIITADGGKLYLRGTGNTIISNENKNWVLSGSNISCEGNIENLLDYATVANGEHPTMETYCFAYLFKNCGALISAPALPATTLTFGCYLQMFYGCTKLVNAPALPATTLANMCYQHMFCDCTSLTSIPAISALILIRTSCYGMLEGCSSVKFSITQTEEYKYEYRIPSSGEGTKDGQPFTRMFASTGGTFTDDPTINTTYYTANEVVYYEPEPEEPEPEEPEATATVITYNGETIATLEAGQTATIKTAETEVDYDIVVTAGSGSSKPILQEKTATENGEYLPDRGYDGFSKVVVNVPSGGGGGGITTSAKSQKSEMRYVSTQMGAITTTATVSVA